ncbi:hypothetical protein D5366_00700 [Neokomagataea tanensis]|uniref:Uncharacterized protein n=1 Tax=Neokomagataea tanensis TaxID=661191 RepID=A0A4Y6V6R4_9PROT|nr:hypothetical protein D5366_00700 [Neokomagataea tanensis]
MKPSPQTMLFGQVLTDINDYNYFNLNNKNFYLLFLFFFLCMGFDIYLPTNLVCLSLYGR